MRKSITYRVFHARAILCVPYFSAYVCSATAGIYSDDFESDGISATVSASVVVVHSALGELCVACLSAITVDQVFVIVILLRTLCLPSLAGYAATSRPGV